MKRFVERGQEFIDAKWRSPIDEVIDHTIQACPIDTRRKLYSNIVLSGGSTTIKNFKERLQVQVQVKQTFVEN